MQEPVKSALETGERYSASIDDLMEMIAILQEYARYNHAGMELVLSHVRQVGELAKALNVSVEKGEELKELLTMKADLWQESNKSAVDLVEGSENTVEDATSRI